MKETSSHPTVPQTELRLARGLWDGFRQDFITDAFALRPLPLLPADSAFIRLLPDNAIRDYARRLPHIAIGLLAFFLLTFGFVMQAGSDQVAAFAALFAAIPLAMTLLRPIGAWWLSVAVTLFMGLAAFYSLPWPWTAVGFISHLAVMTVVATRSRPRVAAGMWVITAFIGALFTVYDSWRASDAGAMFVLSALVLLTVWAIRSSRTTKQQAAVTEVERTRRTVLEERTTIARELHDVVAHHMSVIAIQAEAAPYRVTDPPEELTRSFAVIRENAVIALTELRRVLGVVRAEDYEAPDAPQPTLAALDSLLANVRDAGLTVDKVITGAVRALPQGVELSAYRIIQEALSNALRHAPGAPARVEISYVPVGLGLRIVNGPPTGSVRPSPGAGHGLLGMRERATMLGGEVTTEPTDDGGYEVVAFLPVGSEA
ncbi:sensor histidine kinase [Actinacidiphila soli]|uniref:sensor histidine kinase n=1 Tax=Actinacidiphila soli TaxID=2487275 RepID=UPI001F0CAC46|nr:histidine kinase [Actinacidiphila soli]